MKGKDPDDAFSSIPYEKGFTFLSHLEKLVGKEKWDKFIPHVSSPPKLTQHATTSHSHLTPNLKYFTTFARQSLDSYDFQATLLSFFSADREASTSLTALDWHTWFHAPGFPPKPDFDTSLVDVCYALASKWETLSTHERNARTRFEPKASDISSWSANQVVVFLERVQEFKNPLKKADVHVMGQTYGFAKSGNVEVVSRYFTVGLKAMAEEVLEPTADLLGKVGRMKFVRPLYRQLSLVDRELAVETFEKNKDFYHPICRGMVEKDLFGTQ